MLNCVNLYYKFIILKVKNIYTYILVYFCNYICKIIFKPKYFELKSLVIIRLDEIGDYLLFQNFIEFIKKSNKYKNYKITIIGNLAWKELTTNLNDLEFIWIDKKSFAFNPIYRLRKMFECRIKKYEVVFNPTYEQNIIFDSSISNIIEAKQKFGCSGHLKRWTKKIIKHIYDNYYQPNCKSMFQFNINKDIVSAFVGEKINIDRPSYVFMDTGFSDERLNNRPYVAFFIGASSWDKKWSIEGFLKLADYLESNGCIVVLIGGKSEGIEFKEYLKNLPSNVINYVGKIGLLQTAKLIDKAVLLLSNDSCGAHFGMLLNTKQVVVLANGTGYPLFCPYPEELGSKYTLIMPEIPIGKHTVDINLIDYETVKKTVCNILSTYQDFKILH